MPDDDLNDDYLFGALRDGLSRLPIPQPPPVESIVARGRARRRRSGLAGVGVAAAGLAVALPVVLTGLNRPSGQVATSVRLGSGPVHVNLAAYSVDSNANGTVTVRLASKQTFDPNKLRQLLAQAGVAAVVNYGSFCATSVQPAGFKQVVAGAPAGNLSSSSSAASSGTSSSGAATASAKVTAMVINPYAMPKRAELSIGYFPGHVAMTLVKVGGPLSCVATDPPGCNVSFAVRVNALTPPAPGDVTDLPRAYTTVPSATTTTLTGTATTTVPATSVPPPSATSALAPSATSPLPAGATTTLPAGATTTLPAGATTTLPGGARRAPAPVVVRCQVPASGSSGSTAATGVTSGTATTTLPSSASTSVTNGQSTGSQSTGSQSTGDQTTGDQTTAG